MCPILCPPPPTYFCLSLSPTAFAWTVFLTPCPPNIHSQTALELFFLFCLSLQNFPTSQRFLTDSHTCLFAPPRLIPPASCLSEGGTRLQCGASHKSLGKLFDMTIWFAVSHPHPFLPPFLKSQPSSLQLILFSYKLSKELYANSD